MLVLIMGVAGSGKTLIGSMLAQALGWEFRDADSFHPPANVQKMSRGIPLTDADREPWLDLIQQALCQWAASGKDAVVACSALKQRYRERISRQCPVTFVYLKGDFELIHSRMAARQGHFMKAEMLASQFGDLEEPADAIVVDISGSPAEIVGQILTRLAGRAVEG